MENARAAGALITEAERRWAGFTPNDMYAAMTEPATVANPPVSTAWSSDFVIMGMYGLIRSGASVWKVDVNYLVTLSIDKFVN